MTPYIITVSIILAGCLAFYKTLLVKETFFRLNRFVLLACLLLSFGLPLIPVPQQLSILKNTVSVQTIDYFNSNVVDNVSVANKDFNKAANSNNNKEEAGVATSSNEASNNGVTASDIITWFTYLYWFGVIAFAINFLMQLIVLLYQAYTNPFIKDGKFRIVEIRGNKAPCSFLNFIFINPEKYDWDTYSQILQHEKTHVAQKHSVDIMLAELALVFQWFNPFAWLYRKEVENNLEFLTDNELLEKEHFDRSVYQISLLKVSAPHFPLGLTANYNQSLLKRRLLMMDAKKSNVHTSWKYFFLLPLFFLFMSLFNKPLATGKPASNALNAEQKPISDKAAQLLTSIEDTTVEQRKEIIQKPVANSLARVKNLPDTEIVKKDSPSTKKEIVHNNDYDYRYDFKNGTGAKKNDTTDIDALTAYIHSLEQLGYKNLSLDQLTQLKYADVSPEYIKMFQTLGFKEMRIEDIAAAKRYDVTADYMQQVRNMGYPEIRMHHMVQFKRLGITQEYINKFRNLGFKDLPADQLIILKTYKGGPEVVEEYKKLGIVTSAIHQIAEAHVFGITPAFIVKMREKGYNYTSLHDYIKLKMILK